MLTLTFQEHVSELKYSCWLKIDYMGFYLVTEGRM